MHSYKPQLEPHQAKLSDRWRPSSRIFRIVAVIAVVAAICVVATSVESGSEEISNRNFKVSKANMVKVEENSPKANLIDPDYSDIREKWRSCGSRLGAWAKNSDPDSSLFETNGKLHADGGEFPLSWTSLRDHGLGTYDVNAAHKVMTHRGDDRSVFLLYDDNMVIGADATSCAVQNVYAPTKDKKINPIAGGQVDLTSDLVNVVANKGGCKHEWNHCNLPTDCCNHGTGENHFACMEHKCVRQRCTLLHQDKGYVCLLGAHQTWRRKGCYEDGHNRVLKERYTAFNDNDPWRCANYCRGYRFMGLEYSRECFCGNSMAYHHQKPSRECRKDCPGNVLYRCGGGWRINVWEKQ